MKATGLWIILGSFALWAQLSAAPTKDSAGPSPLPQLGDTGTHRPRDIPSRDEGSAPPSAVEKDACVLEEDPVPGEATLPPERPACKKRPGNKTKAGSAGKPLCGGKPVSAGKPHLAHVSPTSDGRLTPGCDKTPSGGKASSNSGHATPGKPPPAGKPAPHDQPGSSEKPAAEKPQAEEEPEDAAGDGDGDGSEEEEEEEDSDDDDDDDDGDEEEEEEGDRYGGLSPIFSEDNEEGKQDSFDHELDYGLGQSPLNGDEYHDWWGGGEAEELEAKPEGGEGEGGGADAFEEPAFDVWGDPVERGPRPEARSGLRLGGGF